MTHMEFEANVDRYKAARAEIIDVLKRHGVRLGSDNDSVYLVDTKTDVGYTGFHFHEEDE